MFDLMIPEIDSFNEEVRLIAKDRKISVIYFAFNIFKLIYDETICYGDLVKNPLFNDS